MKVGLLRMIDRRSPLRFWKGYGNFRKNEKIEIGFYAGMRGKEYFCLIYQDSESVRHYIRIGIDIYLRELWKRGGNARYGAVRHLESMLGSMGGERVDLLNMRRE